MARDDRSNFHPLGECLVFNAVTVHTTDSYDWPLDKNLNSFIIPPQWGISMYRSMYYLVYYL